MNNRTHLLLLGAVGIGLATGTLLLASPQWLRTDYVRTALPTSEASSERECPAQSIGNISLDTSDFAATTDNEDIFCLNLPYATGSYVHPRLHPKLSVDAGVLGHWEGRTTSGTRQCFSLKDSSGNYKAALGTKIHWTVRITVYGEQWEGTQCFLEQDSYELASGDIEVNRPQDRCPDVRATASFDQQPAATYDGTHNEVTFSVEASTSMANPFVDGRDPTVGMEIWINGRQIQSETGVGSARFVGRFPITDADRGKQWSGAVGLYAERQYYDMSPGLRPDQRCKVISYYTGVNAQSSITIPCKSNSVQLINGGCSQPGMSCPLGQVIGIVPGQEGQRCAYCPPDQIGKIPQCPSCLPGGSQCGGTIDCCGNVACGLDGKCPATTPACGPASGGLVPIGNLQVNACSSSASLLAQPSCSDITGKPGLQDCQWQCQIGTTSPVSCTGKACREGYRVKTDGSCFLCNEQKPKYCTSGRAEESPEGSGCYTGRCLDSSGQIEPLGCGVCLSAGGFSCDGATRCSSSNSPVGSCIDCTRPEAACKASGLVGFSALGIDGKPDGCTDPGDVRSFTCMSDAGNRAKCTWTCFKNPTNRVDCQAVRCDSGYIPTNGQCVPASACSTAADCADDGNSCTTKTCLGNVCIQMPNQDRCTTASGLDGTCNPQTATCMADCRNAADCDDKNPCTTDTCATNGRCHNPPNSNSCTAGPGQEGICINSECKPKLTCTTKCSDIGAGKTTTCAGKIPLGLCDDGTGGNVRCAEYCNVGIPPPATCGFPAGPYPTGTISGATNQELCPDGYLKAQRSSITVAGNKVSVSWSCGLSPTTTNSNGISQCSAAQCSPGHAPEGSSCVRVQTPATTIVAGRVQEDGGNAPIGGAAVSGGGANSVTDQNGGFVLSGVPIGKFIITVGKTGYTGVSVEFTTVANPTGQVNDAGIIKLKKTVNTDCRPNVACGTSTPSQIGYTCNATTKAETATWKCGTEQCGPQIQNVSCNGTLTPGTNGRCSCSLNNGEICQNDAQCTSKNCVSGKCAAAPQCSSSATCPDISTACQVKACTGGICGQANAANGSDCGTNGKCLDGACIVGSQCTPTNAASCPDPGVCKVKACTANGACAPANAPNDSACKTSPAATGNNGKCQAGVCVANAVCGNGIKEGSEECDDGNTNDNDACSTNTCKIQYLRCTNAMSCAYGPSQAGKSCSVAADCCTGKDRPNGCSCDGDALNCASQFCRANDSAGGEPQCADLPAVYTCSSPDHRAEGCGCTSDSQCLSNKCESEGWFWWSKKCQAGTGAPPAPTDTPAPTATPTCPARPPDSVCIFGRLTCSFGTWICET